MSARNGGTQPPERWRRLPYHVGSSELHIHQSDALVRLSSAPTLWWHSTEQPTLILGAAQAGFDLARCESAGVLAVRRHAGGSAVYAEAGVLGLDIMLPAGHRLAHTDVLETYRWLGEIWQDALRALGVTTHLVSIQEARAAASQVPADAPIRMACFGTLSPYELTAKGRKLVGLAQVRRRNGVLLQSAIHQHFDADRLAALLEIPSDLPQALQRAAIGLDELTNLPGSRIIATVEETLADTLNVSLVDGGWTAAEQDHVDASNS